ncbi:S1/P1 nuclease [Mucilaginibacter sp. AW1-3]
MKKFFATAALMLVSVMFISWGDKGHSAIGLIAQNHLSSKAQAAVKKIIGSDNLADVANYADEIKSDANLRYTTPWHFADLPSGYTFEQFAAALKALDKGNVYNAILSCEHDLTDASKGRVQKAFALKLLVHFVGDCHQPMHIGHAEDRGGNSISIKFLGESGNLHGLWDYMLIDHENMNYKQMAAKYDTATPEQIKQWQNDSVLKWMYESYVITNELYKEAAENPDLKQDYYDDHIELLHQRILKAGIRLAGVLNRIYDSGE